MKASNAPLERKRPILFVIGLLLACSFTLVSFEWRIPYVDLIAEPIDLMDTEDPFVMPTTFFETAKKYKRPEAPKAIDSQTFEITETTKTGEETPFFPTAEDIYDGNIDTSSPDEEDLPDDLYAPLDRADVNPAYCDGEKALLAFLHSQLAYPDIPRTNGVSGVVYVQFVVDKNGTLRDAKVLRPLDPWLDAEALRVTKLLNCFTPGLQGGRAVDVYFRLPIRFRLG